MERSPLGRAISLAIAVTSAFWVALGAWLFHAHMAADHTGGDGPEAGAEAPASRAGLLDGLSGGSGGGGAGIGIDHRVGSPTAAPLGTPPRTGRLTIPVARIAPGDLTDTFSQARAEGARHHDAIDIPAPEGTPVIAAAAGRVEKLFLSDEGGQTIYVRSPDRRLIYYYAHLGGYAPGLREGSAVRRGQVLGAVGHTGNATPEAPHLHFALWQADPKLGWYQDTRAFNPYPLLGGRPPAR